MSRIETVRAAMMQAMKDHDKERKEALSLLLSALKNKAIDKRADLTEDEETPSSCAKSSSVRNPLSRRTAVRILSRKTRCA